jgi:hypothetical protein
VRFDVFEFDSGDVHRQISDLKFEISNLRSMLDFRIYCGKEKPGKEMLFQIGLICAKI